MNKNIFTGVVRELIVSGSGEEDMSALLCGMHAAPNDALKLKLHILKALLACLRDSHRTRTIFRKVFHISYSYVNCYVNVTFRVPILLPGVMLFMLCSYVHR